MFTWTNMSNGKTSVRGGKYSGRGGKHPGYGDKVVMKHREANPVSSWLNLHKEDLTLELCLEQWTQQEDKMSLINELIDLIPTNPQFLNILNDLKPHFPGRVKHGGGYQYNPFHKINWLPETTDHQIIGAMYDIVHDVGYDVFMKNKQKEDAFLSLLKKFKFNRDDPNYIFRYNQLVKFSKNEINKLVTSIFNKIENINSEMIEIAHVLLLQDYHTVLKRMADAMVMRKIPSQCITFDTLFLKYVEGILKILSGAKTNFADLTPVVFCDQEKTMPTFELFFKQNESVLPDTTQLVKVLWEYVIEITLQSTGEYKNLNFEAMGIVIGGFTETNRLYDQYKDFVLGCLDQTPKGFYANINNETRLRMALRAIVQSKQSKEEVIKTLPQEILHSLKSFPYPSTYYQVIIEELFGSFHSIQIVQQKSTVIKTNYFADLDEDNIDDTIEYAVDLLNKHLNQQPLHKSTIIQNFIASLLENVKPKYTVEQIKQFGKYFASIKKDIIREQDVIERNVIADLKPDIPYCDKVWKDLIKILG